MTSWCGWPRVDAPLSQRHALVHAEAVLLVDDDERQVAKRDTFLEQRVRADDELRITAGDAVERIAPRRGALAAAEPGRLDAKRFEPGREVAPVLFGEQLGRRHDRRLHAAGDRLEAGDRGDHGLARAHVALDQSHHRVRLREVPENFRDDALLGARQ